MEIYSKPVAPANACSPIDVIDGNESVVNPAQDANAAIPMV
jgi:hypothetical protein